MRILLDQNFPKRVARALHGHFFRTAYDMGWAELENGDLLAVAEAAGFDLMLTADRRIRYQQNQAAHFGSAGTLATVPRACAPLTRN